MTTTTLKAGDRVRLTRTMLDNTTDVHPVHLYAGDAGTVVERKRELGVAFDRYEGDITSFRRELDGQRVMVIDHCQPVRMMDEV